MASKKPTVAELQAQIDQLTAALQQERADAVNLRRRNDEQIAGLRTSVKSSIIADLLPIVDNFERALKHTPHFRHSELDSESLSKNPEILNLVQDDVKKYQTFVGGVEGVVKQFEKTLSDLGVERIKTIGEPFDPNVHEAVSLEGEGSTEIVSEELQAGYKIGSDVIRHAMVRVQANG